MQKVDDAEIITRLWSDTYNEILQWEIAITEPLLHFPVLKVIRAFKTKTGEMGDDYFLAIEYIMQRYDPEFDTRYGEPAYLVALVGRGVVGHVITESGFPDTLDLAPLLDMIAYQASNASTVLNGFLNRKRDYDKQLMI